MGHRTLYVSTGMKIKFPIHTIYQKITNKSAFSASKAVQHWMETQNQDTIPFSWD